VIESCPRQSVLIPRIERSLGVRLGNVQCRIVDQAGMEQAMRRAGWSRNETLGVVGFQIGSRVYVRKDAPWTVLHELVHRSGVNADRLNRFVAEGLTEAIALELKESAAEHQPTYPEETRWVQQVLLAKLGMTAVELGSRLAKSSNPPRTLAALLARKDPSLDEGVLARSLQPQRPERPAIGSQLGFGPSLSPTREPPPFYPDIPPWTKESPAAFARRIRGAIGEMTKGSPARYGPHGELLSYSFTVAPDGTYQDTAGRRGRCVGGRLQVEGSAATTSAEGDLVGTVAIGLILSGVALGLPRLFGRR
jgi:hypothetical protein